MKTFHQSEKSKKKVSSMIENKKDITEVKNSKKKNKAGWCRVKSNTLKTIQTLDSATLCGRVTLQGIH